MGSDSESKVKSSTMDTEKMLLAVSIVSLAIVLSFATGYYVAVSQAVRAARNQPIHLSKTETVYHVSRACSSLNGARTVKTLNVCSRCPREQ